MKHTRKINALAAWFGANRQRAEMVGKLLGRCAWVGVPFMGGGSELPHIDCREGVAGDLHHHIINLARVIADPDTKNLLAARLAHTLFHEAEFRDAQARLRERDGVFFGVGGGKKASESPRVEWAFDYFVCCWMGPGAKAGKADHFSTYFPVRWSATGGGSAKRFRSAVESLDGWCEALKRWQFVCQDSREMLDRIETVDRKRRDAAMGGSTLDVHGVYADPPWPDAGREYKHVVNDSTFHQRLEERLRGLTTHRVVVRYGDGPLIRSLYDRPEWARHETETRSQANTKINEVLITSQWRCSP